LYGIFAWLINAGFTRDGTDAGLLMTVPPCHSDGPSCRYLHELPRRSGQETAAIPSYVNAFGRTVPGYVNMGTGTLTLAFGPLTSTLSSPSQVTVPGASNNLQMLPAGTTDNPQVTVTASSSTYPVANVTFSTQFLGNPHSNYQASLSIPAANGASSNGAGKRTAPNARMAVP